VSVPAYPEYKDSGVPWLGDVPGHWSLEPLRGQFLEHKVKNDGADDQNYLSLVAGRGVMPYAEKGDIGNKKPDDLEKCKVVKSGNFVINSMNFGIGAFGVSAYDGVCSPVYVVLEPSQPKSLRFLRWIFDNPGFREVAQSFGNGILAHRAAIGWDELKAMWIGVPPLAEQAAIAAFLDGETAKIDGLVAEQKRLIALLKEKRQAIISHTVTKGLNPDAPMKDSGIEWLGEIPAHWEVGPVKRCARVLPGYAFSAADFSQDSHNCRLLRGINVSPQGLRWNEETVYWERDENDGFEGWELAEGDVVIGMDRPWIGDGIRATLVTAHDLPCLLLQRVASLRAKDGLDSRFLLRCFQHDAFYHHCAPDLTGVSVPHLSGGQIEEFRIPLPPQEEARAICDQIDQKILELGALTTQVQSAIALLQERRAALISAAVTGKIDVRGLAATVDELEAA